MRRELVLGDNEKKERFKVSLAKKRRNEDAGSISTFVPETSAPSGCQVSNETFISSNSLSFFSMSATKVSQPISQSQTLSCFQSSKSRRQVPILSSSLAPSSPISASSSCIDERCQTASSPSFPRFRGLPVFLSSSVCQNQITSNSYLIQPNALKLGLGKISPPTYRPASGCLPQPTRPLTSRQSEPPPCLDIVEQEHKKVMIHMEPSSYPPSFSLSSLEPVCSPVNSPSHSGNFYNNQVSQPTRYEDYQQLECKSEKLPRSLKSIIPLHTKSCGHILPHIKNEDVTNEGKYDEDKLIFQYLHKKFNSKGRRHN